MFLTCYSSGAPLPLGFDHVYLGKKEVEKVKKVGKNAYREEGEMPGQERHDFHTGKPIDLSNVSLELQNELQEASNAPQYTGYDQAAVEAPPQSIEVQQ